MTNRIGQHLGNYQLIELLGQGHWASVYLGRHRHLHTQAAIKVLHEPLAPTDVEGFLSEARTLAHLRHPHIVQVLDFGVQEGIPFLVLEYAPGGTLRKLHPKGARLPLETVISYVKQVASALQYAHVQRLIHRDLKPENLLLGPEQQIWLADFGLAVVVHSARSQPFQQTAGTLAYMAPEQLKGQPTPASDQYALGVMVYEWLCGEQPFSGSFPELAVQHTLAPPPSLTKKVPTLPAGVEHVVLTALAKDPEQRFAGTHAFALALEEACRTDAFAGQTLPLLSSVSPAQDRQAIKHNLPAQLTSFLGREQEVTAACTLLRRPEVRLVTLTGTGGIGKTRLALHVATQVMADFPDGVYFVSLAPLSDQALVMSAIAQVLDVKESGARPLLDLLTAFLREKRLLLCLDNFEQLLPAAPHLMDLLTRCPHLTILVTSRTVLHVQGEHDFPVPPLALPNLTRLPPIDTLPHYPAVALFLQRAQATKPTFQLTSTNARPIVEMCIRLDGLPLAIELAAARINLLSPQALLARLGQRLALLTSGTQNAPARQQTLRNTIAWSYHLLDAQEQQLFRHLSVFVGGCTLQAIEALNDPLGEGNGVGQILDGVGSLIDKSLLQQTEQEDGEPRLVMLETIREYGQELLSASGEVETTRHAHAAYYLTLAEKAEPELEGPQQIAWLERLEREHDNLRAVLAWSLERQPGEEVGRRRELALRMGRALMRFWITRGHLREGRAILEQALRESEDTPTALLARAQYVTGTLVWYQGDYDRAEELCQQSLTSYRELGDQWGITTCLHGAMRLALARGNAGAARACGEEALTMFRTLGDKGEAARTLEGLTLVALSQGNYAEAESFAEECLSLGKAIGMRYVIARPLLSLTRIAIDKGEHARAYQLLSECLSLCHELGDKGRLATALALSGRLAFAQGDAIMARSLAAESLMLFRETEDQQGAAESLSILGMAEAAQGNYTVARALYKEWLSLAGSDERSIAFSLEGLADAVVVQGQLAWAVRLWSTAETVRGRIGVPMQPGMRAAYSRKVTATRAQLGEQTFAAIWAEGRAMTPEQALAAQEGAIVHTPLLTRLISAPFTKEATYPDGLTAREVDVLRLLAQGLTNAQIAEELVVSLLTVKAHLRSIYSKLGVTSRSAATRYALEHDLS